MNLQLGELALKQRGGLGIGDETLVDQVVHRNRTAVGLEVPVRSHDDDLVLVVHGRDKVSALGLTGNKREVDEALEQKPARLAVRALGNLDLNAGVVGHKAAQRLRETHGHDTRGSCDAEDAVVEPPHAAHSALKPRERLAKLQRFLEQTFAVGGKAQLRAFALKQPNSPVVLKARDRPAQRRLRRAELTCRGGNAPQPGRHAKRLNLADVCVHAPTFQGPPIFCRDHYGAS